MAKVRVNTLLRERLREVLDYDHTTGIFVWRRGQRAGEIAGSIYTNGYRYIQVDGVPWRGARLAWLYVKGEPIPDEIDHRSTVKSDDRIENLRASTTSQNQANRGLPSNATSGLKGVTWQPSRGKWFAKITVHGKAINLGRFATKEEAAAAYESAARAAFGEFARTTKE